MKRAAAYVCGVIATAGAFSQATIGCNTIGDVAPSDASVADIARPDAPLAACASDPPPVMKVLDGMGNEVDGDWSCYATDAGFLFPLGADADADTDAQIDADLDATTDGPEDAADGEAGADAGPQPCRFRLTDFVDLAPVPGAAIDLFFSNDIKQAPDFSATTGDKAAGDSGPGHAGVGEFFFPPPGTPQMAYRVNARTGVAGLSDLKAFYWLDNLSCRSGQTYTGQSITKQSFDLLGQGILGTTPIDPAKMTVVVGARDCKYRDASGGIAEIFDDTTGLPLVSGTKDFRAAYFGLGGLPDVTCKHTVAQQSIYAAVNVPADHSFSVRMSGRLSAADSSPVVLGERKLPSISGAIVIVRPYRLTKP